MGQSAAFPWSGVQGFFIAASMGLVAIAIVTNLAALMFMTVDTTPGGACTATATTDTTLARYSEHEIFIGTTSVHNVFTITLCCDFALLLFVALLLFLRSIAVTKTPNSGISRGMLLLILLVFVGVVGTRLWQVVQVGTASARMAASTCVVNWLSSRRMLVITAIAATAGLFMAFVGTVMSSTNASDDDDDDASTKNS
jgi:hypothetical protein